MKRLAALALLPALAWLSFGITNQRTNAAGCAFSQAVTVAFCDTFDGSSPVTNRSGQLNGQVWGVSRLTGDNNLGGRFNAWAPTALRTCTGTQTVLPPSDVQVCNGQVHEATNDNGSVTVLAMYPKQPFDFAGRTGTVVFDVSNDTQGTHAAWPEFWLTDLPTPAPFVHEGPANAGAVPQHAFGLRLGGANAPGCIGKWNVDSAVVVRNFVVDDSFMGGTPQPQILNCGVTLSDGNSLNHIELRISQTSVQVWATDAGTIGPLIHIADIPNANLTLTRGLVWIEDVHYNANKVGNQGQHTFIWDNVGFDGPFTYRDASYDVPDALAPIGDGAYSLGYPLPADVKTVPVDGSLIPVATAARLMFNAYFYNPPNLVTYTVNGHTHSAAPPDPYQYGFSTQTMQFTLPLSDLVAGPNSITINTDQFGYVANVNIVLVNVSGGAPATPTVSPTPKPIATPTVTPTTTDMRQCTLRWGNNTLANFGRLTLSQCQAVHP